MNAPKFEIDDLGLYIIGIVLIVVVLITGEVVNTYVKNGYVHKEAMLALEKGYKEVKGTESNFTKMGVHLKIGKIATATKEVLNAEDNR